MGSLRNQLKATPIAKLQKIVDKDSQSLGDNTRNEYLSLEDGKTLKIRLFPAHPGGENFYVRKKSYWLTVAKDDGDTRRTTVLDSRDHGNTKLDIVDEFIKYVKKKFANDAENLACLTAQKDGLKPVNTWVAYAAVIDGDDQLKPKLWEFKKMVRDGLNKLAFSEDEDEAIVVDPFTDVDEGLPVLVKYMKKPNEKKGEKYYDVMFSKKATAHPLSDEECDTFMTLKPLSELFSKYSLRDFERALEGVQNFDDDNELGVFEDDEWLDVVEQVKSQYDEETEDEEPKKPTNKPAPPTRKTTKKVVAPVVEEEDEEEEDEDDDNTKGEVGGDEFDDMDRTELKKHITANGLSITIKKSMSDDDIRIAIRNAQVEEEEAEDEEEEEDDTPQSTAEISVADIRAKLASRKKK